MAKRTPYQIGDIISADPKLFDATPGSYSKDNPEKQIGEVIKVFGAQKIIQITSKWLDKSKSHLRSGEFKVEKNKFVPCRARA